MEKRDNNTQMQLQKIIAIAENKEKPRIIPRFFYFIEVIFIWK
jgi:hypothetical protein